MTAPTSTAATVRSRHAVIEGGREPRGIVKVSGAKNSATRLLAAALLSDEQVELSSFPTSLVDVGHKVEFTRRLGGMVDFDMVSETIRVSGAEVTGTLLEPGSYDVPIRTTYLMAASQLMRSGLARVPYPGGCQIGRSSTGGRGYDLHIMVWEELGCTVEELDDHLLVQASAGMRGAEIRFPIMTVGGTENALICASVASGTTTISNAYITPEVNDLIQLLRQMGAHVAVYGSSRIVVEGRSGPLSGTRMDVMPDRIEALTWIVYAILSNGSITVDNVPFDSMVVPLLHLEHAGIDLMSSSSAVHVTPSCRRSGFVEPFELACGTYPGVISDMQPLFVLLALAADGISRVFDYRYPKRIAYVAELAKLVEGEHLHAVPGSVTIHGPARFIPGEAESTDLRGSVAAMVAALCAPGTSTIRNAQMALRGYNNLDGKLRQLGIPVTILDDQAPERRD